MEKKIITLSVSVHWIKYEIIKALDSGKINLSKDSFRSIAEKIGIPKKDKGSAQKVKHHLEALVSMGTIDKVKGIYIYK